MKKQDILKTQEEIYSEVMKNLQDVWKDNRLELLKLHSNIAGIRSSQIGALVMLLIEKGILK